MTQDLQDATTLYTQNTSCVLRVCLYWTEFTPLKQFLDTVQQSLVAVGKRLVAVEQCLAPFTQCAVCDITRPQESQMAVALRHPPGEPSVTPTSLRRPCGETNFSPPSFCRPKFHSNFAVRCFLKHPQLAKWLSPMALTRSMRYQSHQASFSPGYSTSVAVVRKESLLHPAVDLPGKIQPDERFWSTWRTPNVRIDDN